MSMTEQGIHATATAQRFIVRYGGVTQNWAVKFHHNLCGNVFAIVAEDEGTTFATEDEARKTAVKFNIRKFTISPL